MKSCNREALLLGAYQSLLLGGLMRYFGALAGIGSAAPFIAGLAFAGFALGARAQEKKHPARTDALFAASAAALGFLLIGRLYFFSIFRTLFMGENPAGNLLLTAASILLSCHLFGYAGHRYSRALRAAENPVANYALLAAGFALGTALYGVLSAIAGPDAALAAALLGGIALVENRKVRYAGIAAAAAAMLCAVPVRERHFDNIAFSWGVTDYRRAAGEWSPYYRVDLLTYNDGENLCVLYNYTCMMLGFKHTGAAAGRRMQAARYLMELHEASVPPEAESILIVGSGVGLGHPAILRPSVKKITAVEIDPAIMRLMKGDFSEYNNGFYRDPRVKTVVAEGRRFLEKSSEKFDFIEYESLDTRMYSTAMNVVPVENALYTREGISSAMDRLSEGGLFRITIGTDDDANVVRPLVAGLPEDASYEVYRLWIDMADLAGTGAGLKRLKGSLGGYTGHMPQTVIFASRKKENIDRIGAWYESLGAGAPGKIKRIEIGRERGRALTDDHPFMGGPKGPERNGGLIPVLLAAAALLSAWLTSRRNANGRLHYYFYLIGAGYIGLEILLLARGARSSPNPALTSLEIAAVFVAGNALACAAAGAKTPGKGTVAAAAILLAVLVHFSYLASGSPAAALAGGAAAGFLGGLFWPAALAGLEPDRRGHALFSDALGAFPGIVLFHGALFLSGFRSAGLFVSLLYAFAAALLVFRRAPRLR